VQDPEAKQGSRGWTATRVLLVAGAVLVPFMLADLVLGLASAAVATAVATLLLCVVVTRPSIPSSDVFADSITRRSVDRARPGDVDLALDLDAVAVDAVYVVGSELLAHLSGGIGQRRDPLTGEQRQLEATDVTLTWRCTGARNAARLARQLNQWQARQTPLRLLAARGRCASLIEDNHVWVVLPELRLAA
jgi:hypothetical protein